MMKRSLLYSWWAMTALVVFSAHAGASRPVQRLSIPEATNAQPRRITIQDMSALRRIDTLRLSPDRRRFAILVRQADADDNTYRSGWFAGSTNGGPLIPLGDGGEARLAVGLANTYSGFEHPTVRWSPDGRWIAYALARGGEIQLWRSRTDGRVQEQITHNVADVRDFEWSKDGKSLYFTAGTARAELRARQEAKQRDGYHYDTDLRTFTDLMGVLPPASAVAAATDVAIWVVTLQNGRERLASEAERSEFEHARQLAGAGYKASAGRRTGAFAESASGWQARARLDATGSNARMEVSKSASEAAPTQCAAEECSGLITQVWWGDENTVLFLRHEGLRSDGPSLYAWTVATGAVSLVARTSDSILAQCDVAFSMRMVCVRESATLPPHVAFLEPGTDGIQILADVNPEFRHITLGKVERLEWHTPKFKWSEPGAQLEGIYEDRAYGYILYPPDFDPARKYPVFISPYAAAGFDNMVNQEYALHVMAANGFVVLNLTFPSTAPGAPARVGPDLQKLIFSAELGFPHLSMQLESTVRALDLAVAKGFVDERRVGIGGVSAGASMPARMLQKYDRLAAVSLAGGVWSQLEYYLGTQRLWQPAQRASSWMVKPAGSGLDLWKQIELADNVETIEAPILINTPATETVALIRLMRHMAEAGKPYDAYVFPQEPHIKWQPAHLRACMQRNLDWFRFWLQSYEDPAPSKGEQYSRWRKLRETHTADRARAAQESRQTQLNPQPLAAPAPVPN